VGERCCCFAQRVPSSLHCRRSGARHSAPIALAFLLFLASLVFAACAGPRSRDGHWQLVSSGLREAVLSISGSSATNVWAVGADAGAGPIVLHYDGASWTRVSTGSSGTLWWTQVFSDGTIFMAGAQSTILRSTDGTTFTRMPTPGLASYTVFGLWGASPTDVYAVGSTSGRNGFIWHYRARSPLAGPALAGTAITYLLASFAPWSVAFASL